MFLTDLRALSCRFEQTEQPLDFSVRTRRGDDVMNIFKCYLNISMTFHFSFFRFLSEFFFSFMFSSLKTCFYYTRETQSWPHNQKKVPTFISNIVRMIIFVVELRLEEFQINKARFILSRFTEETLVRGPQWLLLRLFFSLSVKSYYSNFIAPS